MRVPNDDDVSRAHLITDIRVDLVHAALHRADLVPVHGTLLNVVHN